MQIENPPFSLPAQIAVSGLRLPKPLAIGERALQALEAGAHEVLADEMTKQVKAGLSAAQAVYLAAR